MARTVPTLLGRVPLDDTLEVRAHRGAVMERAALVAVRRDLVDAVPNDPPFAARDVRFVDEIGREEVLDVTDGDVGVLFGELLDRVWRERHAAWVVNLLPGILASHDKIREEDAGD